MVNNLVKIELGGVEQFIHIKGDADNNPLLLFIHGGPGATLMPYSHLLEGLEDEFLVVHWDQRGAGKSYDDSTPATSMCIEQFIDDSLELVDYLRDCYSKEKVYIAGHSWGSVLGVNLAQRIADKIHAYFGICQVTDYIGGQMESYDFALECSKTSGQKDMEDVLLAMGKPPYEDINDTYKLSGIIYQLGGAYHKQVDSARIFSDNPIYDNGDIEKINKGMAFSAVNMIDEIVKINLLEAGHVSFDVPVYFICGQYDYFTPVETIKKYYNAIEAPKKAIYTLEESAHFPYAEAPGPLVDLIKSLK